MVRYLQKCAEFMNLDLYNFITIITEMSVFIYIRTYERDEFCRKNV